ncbi:UDP-N-acetylglucosamine 2-epimerase (non-hydrolysing) [Rhodovulum imhoffii]|uniref:UDP-N-acetylglucosamine 2-epimerase (Non-hydrolysing) n=1 Tax=Rhodovulum imhoffii TaxID=365340 RepID=A0A2T5BU41_9RHOB|nr:UDP-N-acetylglucosamine 2-epimerase [Rhodovulum imhoffii]MBK5932725.1 UDP-N-acetylglucosamine 2-epimerase (hydrolyzing) [Rhodovulum imhoffii]PTN02931.1 UDP-N-acetylglucosamine 2-epimerase (non-hydrolysing) [Rhodovulum imhoffii]
MTEARRHIAVVTVGRSDFSILRPLCEALHDAPDFGLTLWVGGAHFDPAGGMTVADIDASGLPVGGRVIAGSFDHVPRGTTRNMGEQLHGFGEVAAQAIVDGRRPDLVLVLGDRFEACAAGMAMVPFGLPVGHISGGSITEGAIDDMFRHALTKLAAVHFCDVPEFARRIHQMGEEPWRIFTTGALGLDGIRRQPPKPLDEMSEHFGMPGLQRGYVLSTLHPETMAPEVTPVMAQGMVAALAESGMQVVYTYPNADPGADDIIAAIERSVASHPGQFAVRNFGSGWFYSAMAHAGMVVGNSSSGIYEAASFGLPVVDIGDRQRGRLRGENVIHARPDRDGIRAAMAQATALAPTLDPENNIYGDGRAYLRVLAVLRALDWGKLSQPKRFSWFDENYSGARVSLR